MTNTAYFIFLCLVLFDGQQKQDAGREGVWYRDETFQQELFKLSFGVACGPLLGALLITPTALLFHNVDMMTNVMVHILPSMQLYILRWNNHLFEGTWPAFWLGGRRGEEDHNNIFEFLNFWPTDIYGIADGREGFLGSVFGNSMIFYFVWFIPYMIFQLCIGLDLPKQNRRSMTSEGIPKLPKYDTVYHFNMRNGQAKWLRKLFWGRPKEESMRMMETNEYEVRDFFAYMFVHVLGVFLSIALLAWSCSLSRYVHSALIFAVFLTLIIRAANRYVYYSTKMYTTIIQDQYKRNFGEGEEECEKLVVEEISDLEEVKREEFQEEYEC